MSHPARSVIIAGGGSAAWESAAYLARYFDSASPDTIKITVINMPVSPVNGDAASMVPSLARALKILGIAEKKFMADTGAVFKVATWYEGWNKASERGDFLVPFGYEDSRFQDLKLWWLKRNPHADAFEFAETLSIGGSVSSKMKSPKFLKDRDYEGLTEYGFQVNSALWQKTVEKLARVNGVEKVETGISSVRTDDNGWITGIQLESGKLLEADLYIDCTGKESRLLGDALAEPWVSFSDNLPCDHTITLSQPLNKGDPVYPYTRVTAASAGWIWTIPLQDRYCRGYVYSSKYITHEEAEKELRRFSSSPVAETTSRRTAIRSGKYRRLWAGNCIAIGQAGGFVEPLCTTGQELVFHAIARLVDNWPSKVGDREETRVLAGSFNRIMDRIYTELLEFTSMYYQLSSREGSAFWESACKTASPEGLEQKLQLWKQRLPRVDDFPAYTCFVPSEWLSSLAGLRQGLLPDWDQNYLALSDDEAKALGETISTEMLPLVDSLPSHRDFLNLVKKIS